MKLIYYKKHKNFGDALNPMILEKFFPKFFDEDESSVFLGIGSILHMSFPEARQKIIFSTGFAFYGDMPKIDKSYHFACVRGPLTCKVLGLDPKLSITDGAALLSRFNFSQGKKRYEFSYMPHHESALLFNWKNVCESIGFHYIDPHDDPKKIIDEILHSEVVIAEAMHGAIVADALRVPWIPVKFYRAINQFKWKDWTTSLDLDYDPHKFRPLFDEAAAARKIALKFQGISSVGNKLLTKAYSSYQDMFYVQETLKKFSNVRFAKPQLSKEAMLKSKVEQLEEKIYLVDKQFRA